MFLFSSHLKNSRLWLYFEASESKPRFISITGKLVLLTQRLGHQEFNIWIIYVKYKNNKMLPFILILLKFILHQNKYLTKNNFKYLFSLMIERLRVHLVINLIYWGYFEMNHLIKDHFSTNQTAEGSKKCKTENMCCPSEDEG